MAIRGGSSTSCGTSAPPPAPSLVALPSSWWTRGHRPEGWRGRGARTATPTRGGPGRSWTSPAPRPSSSQSATGAARPSCFYRSRRPTPTTPTHRWMELRAYQRGCRHARAVFRGGGTAGVRPAEPASLARKSRAVDADDWTTVEAASKRLLDAAERARVEYGDKLDWSKRTAFRCGRARAPLRRRLGAGNGPGSRHRCPRVPQALGAVRRPDTSRCIRGTLRGRACPPERVRRRGRRAKTVVVWPVVLAGAGALRPEDSGMRWMPTCGLAPSSGVTSASRPG